MKYEITPEQLKTHVEMLAQRIGERNVFRPKALRETEEYIAETWRGQGYHVNRQVYRVHGIECANLEVTRRGRTVPAEIILLGAHYDSVMGSPGANDNGSGVAALIELSRLFFERVPEVTLRFVAFVNEEPPFFCRGDMGSSVYAKAARARGDRIRCMVSLETIGCYSDVAGSQKYPPLFKYFYPDRGDFISFVSNFRSRAEMLEAVRAFRAGSDFPIEYVATFSWIPGVSWSDQLSFWRQGYPAFMITDTAFYRYRYYHSAEDRPEKLCYEAFARCCNGLYQCFDRLSRKR